jgi:arylsulfatase A-like enzyme
VIDDDSETSGRVELTGSRLATAVAALFVLLLSSCVTAPQEAPKPRPNIVLLVVEDLSPRIGAFGDAVARTPNLDRMAQEGMRYTNVFTSAGVCAPSRAALITGMHQAAIGSQHMRTSAYVWTDGSGRAGYEAVPPPYVKAFPELLRAAGYFTVNNSKTDYQFGSPFTVWDENGMSAHWKDRPEGTPFFAMYSQMATHESSLFLPGSLKPEYASSASAAAAMEARRAALPQRTRPGDVVVPPYYPDTPTVRADIARQYDNVQLMDAWVGERLAELEAAGVLDNTIVIWTTDHGDGLPRGKRSLYDSGLHVPMIIRFPDGRGAGGIDDRMISFVDMAPTILSLAGVSTPKHLQGIDALSAKGRAQERVFAERDRFDESTDLSRAVRTRAFKYIRNEYSDVSFYLPLAYRENVPMMAEMRRMFAAGQLSPLQASYFQTPRPLEELYDMKADPDEVRNLAGDPAFRGVKTELASALSSWRQKIGDPGKMPEDAMIKAAWGAGKQPQTAKPAFSETAVEAGAVRVALSSGTEGASIGYRLAGEERWRLYSAPFDVQRGVRIEAKAIRYGFAESDVLAVTPGG